MLMESMIFNVLFIFPFNKYLLKVCYMLTRVLGAYDNKEENLALVLKGI